MIMHNQELQVHNFNLNLGKNISSNVLTTDFLYTLKPLIKKKQKTSNYQEPRDVAAEHEQVKWNVLKATLNGTRGRGVRKVSPELTVTAT